MPCTKAISKLHLANIKMRIKLIYNKIISKDIGRKYMESLNLKKWSNNDQETNYSLIVFNQDNNSQKV